MLVSIEKVEILVPIVFESETIIEILLSAVFIIVIGNPSLRNTGVGSKAKAVGSGADLQVALVSDVLI